MCRKLDGSMSFACLPTSSDYRNKYHFSFERLSFFRDAKSYAKHNLTTHINTPWFWYRECPTNLTKYTRIIPNNPVCLIPIVTPRHRRNDTAVSWEPLGLMGNFLSKTSCRPVWGLGGCKHTKSEKNMKKYYDNMIEQTVKSLWIHVEGCQYCQHWSIVKFTQIQKLQSEILMKYPAKCSNFTHPKCSKVSNRLITSKLFPAFGGPRTAETAVPAALRAVSTCPFHVKPKINPNPSHLFSSILLGENSWKDDPFHRHWIFPPQPSKLGRADQCRCARPKPPVPSCGYEMLHQLLQYQFWWTKSSCNQNGVAKPPRKLKWESKQLKFGISGIGNHQEI